MLSGDWYYRGPPAHAEDDSGWTHHDSPISGSTLDNDSNANSASLVSGPTNGTVVFRSDGTYTYTPPRLWTGPATFTYSANGTWGNDEGQVTISVVNVTPTWAEIETGQTYEVSTEADDYFFKTGDILGQLVAYDPYEGYSLTYGGSSQFLQVTSSGQVVVTDGRGLSEYMASADSAGINMPVSVTDGIVTVMSAFTLDKHNAPDWIDQTEIYVKSSTGQEWSPGTAAELVAILEQIRAQGATLTHLIIKGHGGPDGIPGAAGDGDWLVLDGNRIFIGDSEVTATLNAIHDANSHIDLRGCFSYELGKSLKRALGGEGRVTGAQWYILGIPGTRHAFGWFP